LTYAEPANTTLPIPKPVVIRLVPSLGPVSGSDVTAVVLAGVAVLTDAVVAEAGAALLLTVTVALATAVADTELGCVEGLGLGLGDTEGVGVGEDVGVGVGDGDL